jgi:hypothetical protein
VVYGAGPMALDGSEGQQHPAAAAAPAQRPRRRRRAPLALELPGFSPRPKRDAGGGGGDAAAGARGGFAEAAAAAAAAVQDRGPPPGWVRVNAGVVSAPLKFPSACFAKSRSCAVSQLCPLISICYGLTS